MVLARHEAPDREEVVGRQPEPRARRFHLLGGGGGEEERVARLDHHPHPRRVHLRVAREHVAAGVLGDRDDAVGVPHGVPHLEVVHPAIEPRELLGVALLDEVVDRDDAADAGGAQAHGQLLAEAVVQPDAVAAQVGHHAARTPVGPGEAAAVPVEVGGGVVEDVAGVDARVDAGRVQVRGRGRGVAQEVAHERAGVGAEPRAVGEEPLGVEADRHRRLVSSSQRSSARISACVEAVLSRAYQRCSSRWCSSYAGFGAGRRR